MYALRQWSVKNARPMKALYDGLEAVLLKLHPVFEWLGYRRIDKFVLGIEKVSKGLLFDSQSCGQCILGSTGMACPMNCPKSMRNGPCGGVRADGKCEVDPGMDCVWLLAGKATSVSRSRATRSRWCSRRWIIACAIPPRG